MFRKVFSRLKFKKNFFTFAFPLLTIPSLLFIQHKIPVLCDEIIPTIGKSEIV